MKPKDYSKQALDLQKLNQYKSALECIIKAVELSPASAEYYEIWANIYTDQKAHGNTLLTNIKNAMRLYNIVLLLDPNNEQAQKKYQQSQLSYFTFYKKELELKANDTKNLYGQANLFIEGNDFDTACEIVKNLSATYQLKYRDRLNKGIALCRKDIEAGVEYLEESIEKFKSLTDFNTQTFNATTLNTNLSKVHYELGYFYSKKGQFDKAIDSYKLAVEYSEKLDNKHENLITRFQYKLSLELEKNKKPSQANDNSNHKTKHKANNFFRMFSRSKNNAVVEADHVSILNL